MKVCGGSFFMKGKQRICIVGQHKYTSKFQSQRKGKSTSFLSLSLPLPNPLGPQRPAEFKK